MIEMSGPSPYFDDFQTMLGHKMARRVLSTIALQSLPEVDTMVVADLADNGGSIARNRRFR
jgi:hypothetical protein